MQKIHLNFASVKPMAASWQSLILWLLALGLASILWLSYQHNQARIALLQQQAAAHTSPRPMAADPAIEEKLKLAMQTQQALDVPWMPMLAALETVKAANPNVHLLSISPNKNRAEIKLNGEATAFADITHLLDDLRANKAFGDAALVNQHLEQDDDKKSQLTYVFEINLSWRLASEQL